MSCSQACLAGGACPWLNARSGVGRWTQRAIQWLRARQLAGAQPCHNYVGSCAGVRLDAVPWSMPGHTRGNARVRARTEAACSGQAHACILCIWVAQEVAHQRRRWDWACAAQGHTRGSTLVAARGAGRSAPCNGSGRGIQQVH